MKLINLLSREEHLWKQYVFISYMWVFIILYKINFKIKIEYISSLPIGLESLPRKIIT